MKKIFITCFLVLGLALLMFACAPSFKAVKATEATHQKGKGRLITSDGYKFSYRFYPSSQKSPSVIYIPGLGGRVAWGGKRGGYALASPLNKANFNFIGFDRSDVLSDWPGQRQALKHLAKRSKSGSTYFPTIDGKYSSAESIVQNEVGSIIDFIERAPTHDPEKGVYLIGASMGSWVSLVAVHSFPNKIKGVVFLSPAILPEWVTTEAKNQQINIKNYWLSLVSSFGKQRPALAIGNKKDIIAPSMSKDGSSLDGAQLLKKEIGPNVEVMEASSSLHSGEMVANSREVRQKIVQWLVKMVSG